MADMFEKPLWFLIDLLFPALVLIILLMYVDDVGDSMTYEREFLSTDLALFSETVMGSPNPIEAHYPQATLWFGYRFTDAVSVIEPKDASLPGDLEIASHSLIMTDSNLKYEHKELWPEREFMVTDEFLDEYFSVITWLVDRPELPEGSSVALYFSKDAESFSVSNREIHAQTSVFRCGTDRGKINEVTSLVVDPHTVEGLSRSVAIGLHDHFENKFNVIHTVQGNIETGEIHVNELRRKEMKEGADLVLGIRVVPGEGRYASVIKSETVSEDLACLIALGLSEEYESEGASIVNGESPDKEIVIEIGTDNDYLLADQLAQGIARGVNTYYE